MTEYVATRWYRAPEIMLSFKCYTKAIDMWSVGCILAELLGGKPLFKGRDYVDQLNQILSILGTPDDETLTRIGSERALRYIRSLPKTQKIPFSELYPNANPLALDLLEKLLKFDPAERITVEEALAHPYLEAYHDVEDEPSHEKLFDFSFEALDSIEDMKRMITEEVLNFKKNQNGVQFTDNVPRPKESLSGPSRDSVQHVIRDDPREDPNAAMDVDEELALMGN
ncbi:hypothetical protein PIROE2DRAFT_66719 [Piromyces sp. E2]|nr:hypothetical protein PIROE2DRAFT_66719 [Piromyces sp. E2]|eukprot:OUM70217.1 hypothetical protein PIROE2DRAFT_66719 [Piromyces sp. E2]